MLTARQMKNAAASLMLLLMIASTGNAIAQVAPNERLALDLPAPYPWRTEHNESEVARSSEHDPASPDAPFGPIEVSSAGKEYSPSAREYPKMLHALLSSYDDKLQLVVLEASKNRSRYWAIYKLQEKGAQSPAVLAYVLEGKTAIHTVMMELHDQVEPEFVDQWVDIFKKSKLVVD